MFGWIKIAILSATFVAGWWINGLVWEHRSTKRLKAQEQMLIGQCNDQKNHGGRVQ